MEIAPSVVFDPAGSGYHTFRIPSVLTRGELVLAFCEGRLHGSGDAGEIEIVLRRSLDGGQTWLPLQVVSAVPGKTCGNPTPVIDPASGDIVLITVQNGADAVEMSLARGTDPESGRRVFVQRSADDGVSWSPTVEITAQVKPADWGWYATGPCHGIALTTGRLVVPANHSFVPSEPVDDLIRLNGGHCIVSDDGGVTWSVGFVDRNDGPEINANETDRDRVARWTVVLQRPQPPGDRVGPGPRVVLGWRCHARCAVRRDPGDHCAGDPGECAHAAGRPTAAVDAGESDRAAGS